MRWIRFLLNGLVGCMGVAALLVVALHAADGWAETRREALLSYVARDEFYEATGRGGGPLAVTVVLDGVRELEGVRFVRLRTFRLEATPRPDSVGWREEVGEWMTAPAQDRALLEGRVGLAVYHRGEEWSPGAGLAAWEPDAALLPPVAHLVGDTSAGRWSTAEGRPVWAFHPGHAALARALDPTGALVREAGGAVVVDRAAWAADWVGTPRAEAARAYVERYVRWREGSPAAGATPGGG